MEHSVGSGQKKIQDINFSFYLNKFLVTNNILMLSLGGQLLDGNHFGNNVLFPLALEWVVKRERRREEKV